MFVRQQARGTADHRVVIFDLDGTLTRPIIDFDAIREKIGITAGPILEAMDRMSEPDRTRAAQILVQHEWDAARRVSLYDGALETVTACREMGFATAVLTRNTRPIVDFLIDKFGFSFDAIRTREDGAIKPSPRPVLSICEQLGARPESSWMVGDYLFDIMSGQAAGTSTVVMIGDGPVPAFAPRADYVIRRLGDLPALLGIQDGEFRVKNSK